MEKAAILLDVQASHLVPEQPLLEAEADQPGVFKDYIEGAWEQKAINGKGACRNISLAAVKQNNGARFQLLQKYVDMFLVDKNPTGNAGAAPLADATKWEHRQVTTMHWLKNKGWGVQTRTIDGPARFQPYCINSALHVMIKASDRNELIMASAQVLNANSSSDSSDAASDSSDVEEA